MKTHPFKKAVNLAKRKRNKDEEKMISFGLKMMSAAGFNSNDVKEAENHNLIFEAGDFIIEPRHVCFSGGWHYLLIATPRSVGGGVGWSNISHNEFPNGWTYHSGGTGTIVYPNDTIQKEIIRTIESL